MKYDQYRFADLAQFNSEKARGLVHTPEWVALMAIQQAEFDREQIIEVRGDVVVYHP